MDNKFCLTGIQNIDDKYYGINLLRGENSIGYIGLSDRSAAIETYYQIGQVFSALNDLQERLNIKIDLNISQI